MKERLNLNKNVKFILNELNKKGFEAFIVGGCIRDILMGEKTNDFDIITNAAPIKIKEIFKNFNLNLSGEKYGVIKFSIKNNSFEITTYRLEGKYTDLRHPDKIAFTNNLLDDLKRRDFTINTLCYSEEKGLIDIYGGVKDLKNKIIRSILDPDKKFSEDPLRILRAYKFASRFNFQIEENTLNGINKNIEKLSSLNPQTSIKEIKEIFKNGYDIYKMPFIEVVFPEIKVLKHCKQITKYHKYDVYNHTLKAFNLIKPKFKLKLAILFHDIGKPSVKTTDKYGNSHFKSHAASSAIITEEILTRFRLKKKTISYICGLIRFHSIRKIDDKILLKNILREYNEEFVYDLIELKKADDLAKTDKYIKYSLQVLKNTKKLINEITKNNEPYKLKDLAINGHDLIDLGFKDKKISTTLKLLLEYVIINQSKNNKKDLIKFLKKQGLI